jgi:hypothetical protein
VVGSTARITVVRQSGEDIAQREIFMALDGKDLAILRHGEGVSTEVNAGPHRLRAHNTLFWKTQEFELRPGEHARFTVVNRAGWGTYSMMGWLGAGPIYLTFDREPEEGNPPVLSSTPPAG